MHGHVEGIEPKGGLAVLVSERGGGVYATTTTGDDGQFSVAGMPAGQPHAVIRGGGAGIAVLDTP